MSLKYSILVAVIVMVGCGVAPSRGGVGPLTTDVKSDTAVVTTTAEGRESTSGVEVRGTTGAVETNRYGMSPEMAAQLPVIFKFVGSLAAFVVGFMFTLLFLDSPVKDMKWRIICIGASLVLAFGAPLLIWLTL